MKTGVVMELSGGKAVVLQPGGVFTQQAACPGWKVGDVVPLAPPAKPKLLIFRRLALSAACLALVALAGLAGYTFFFETASVISMDINPSVALELNRVGRVLAFSAYNDDGSKLAEELNLKGMPYKEAIPALVQSETLRPYLENNQVLEFAVYSQTDEQDLLLYLDEQGAGLAKTYSQLQVHCSGLGYEVVEQARMQGVSPGKMRALLELQALDPSVNIGDYRHHSMNEIRQMICEHQEQAGTPVPDGCFCGDGGQNGHGGRTIRGGGSGGQRGRGPA